MVDEQQLKRRVLLRILGSPATIFPFMLGMTAMTATWALGWNSGLGWFAGLAGILAAAGSGVTRLLVSGQKIAEGLVHELAAQERHLKGQALDELDRRLTVADNDPRPETALRDLRALLKAFDDAEQSSGFNMRTAFDIRSMVSQLFDQCVQSLYQTERLWDTAQKLGTPAARQPILHQRERIIVDVQASIKQLSDTLVTLQTMGTGERSTADLSRLREELDQSLAVAKKVEERLDNLVREAGVNAVKEPLQLNQQQKGKQL